tara:strand:+ start:15289 stop:17208 length:1920 start_codon:yes stop_codon:yes gene_type:complete
MSINNDTFPLLSQIDKPADMRALDESQLVDLASELREFMLQELNTCGGHFAGNLGTVEIAMACHYVFNTPEDRIVWDVGHQAYPHKILTGRRDLIHTIRQTGGLAPFPNRAESEYDTFTVGHSSTSISAALGMAMAAKLQGIDRKAIAVIGDGAMSAGMVFEALNHAGTLDENLIIILNDNDMSISPPTGALSNYFARTMSSRMYTGFREGSKKVLEHMPGVKEFARRTEEHLKGMIVPGTLFEELGCNYLGPFDGHDLKLLIRTLNNVKDLKGPQLIHLTTMKGKGYPPAEQDPETYHAVSPGFLDRDTTNAEDQPTVKAKPMQPTYSNVFGNWLHDIAVKDERVVGITPAMLGGSDLKKFHEAFPNRCFDVGIAEQHAVTVAAGMACEGLKPIVAIYSTFLQRAYDQMLHDIAIPNLPVVFAIDRAGIVGGDGTTHNGVYDIAYLRCVPNMMVMAPADENETRQMLYTAYLQDSPTAVRYPRGKGPNVHIDHEMKALPVGKALLRRQGQSIAILAFGSMLEASLQVGEALDATVVNMRFVKPIDEDMIQHMAKTHDCIITVEEGVIMGGAGSAVNEVLIKHNITCPTLNLGIPDQHIEHGDPKDLLASIGLDTKGIEQSIHHFISTLSLCSTRKTAA